MNVVGRSAIRDTQISTSAAHRNSRVALTASFTGAWRFYRPGRAISVTRPFHPRPPQPRSGSQHCERAVRHITLTCCQRRPRHGLPRLPQRCEGCQPTNVPRPGRRMLSLWHIPRYPKRDHYPTLLEARRTDGGAPHGQDGRVAGSTDCHERMLSTLPDRAKGQDEASRLHTFASDQRAGTSGKARKPAPQQMRNSFSHFLSGVSRRAGVISATQPEEHRCDRSQAAGFHGVGSSA